MPGTTTLSLTAEQHELLALATAALRKSLRNQKSDAAIEKTRLEVSSQIFVRLAAESKANPTETEKLAIMAINAANVFISAYMHINGKAD